MSNTVLKEFDLIIIGAGIIGCSAAKAFGSDGRKVLLLERDLSEPDRIVGELLQPGGMNALKELGLQCCVEDIDAVPCYGYGVFHNDQMVHIPYPVDEITEKKAFGKSFHHGRFISNLRKAASNTENVTVKELTVNSLIKERTVEACPERVIGVVALDKSNKEFKFFAPLTIVCDEKKPDTRSNFVGFIIKDLELPLPHHGHVILAKNSPVLMYQISTHDTRVLVDIPGKLPSASNGDLKKYMEEVVAPELPNAVRSKFLNALETQKLRSMPNGFLPPSLNHVEGMIVLGDAMNIRHPLTGGGMTVAFNDVVLLKQLLSPENIPSFTLTNLILKKMSTFHWNRKKYCTAINVLAMSLYRVFAANDDEDLSVLQRGCYAYFQLGGDCVNGPVSLLSGLLQRPLSLVYYFFSVAFYAIRVEFKRKGWSGVHYSFIMIFTVLYTACVTILPYLWSEAKY
ncbi:Squalene epoxidase [Rhizopus stolonifer]|uniref:Squalene monooxygenase n=1 Tax=Rhizopus stolonifer TaxID=4846 RepID=A0A367KT92_RHIST|nr:Squalene epoxidase [Rhizopus stolonifer]